MNMRISNKIHSGTAVAAAVIMLITTFLSVGTNVFTLIANFRYYENSLLISSVSNLAISTITCILMAVVLFRRKKDTAAGIIFAITAVPVVITGVFGNVTSIFSYLSMSNSLENGMLICFIATSLIRLIANVASAAFRVFIAMECFNPGNISGGKMKSFLVILPIASIVLTIFATMVQNLYLVGDYGFGEYLLTALLPAVFAALFSAVYVVIGLAFSTPVYEQNPYESTYTGQSYYNYN